MVIFCNAVKSVFILLTVMVNMFCIIIIIIIIIIQYIKRHDRVCAQLHFNICKETWVQFDKKHWYEHVPKSVETRQGGKVNKLWHQQVQTDRTIPNNKPDIMIRDNEKEHVC